VQKRFTSCLEFYLKIGLCNNLGFLPQGRSFYAKSSTTFLFDTFGSIHDLEQSKFQRSNLHLALVLFTSHWGHLSIIFLWLAGNLFHVGWSGNYTIWLSNPILFTPISHSVWDPHVDSYGSNFVANSSFCGEYNWLLSIGFYSTQQIYLSTIILELFSSLMIVLAIVNETSLKRLFFTKHSVGASYSDHFLVLFGSTSIRLNFHIGVLFGFTSLLWSGHIAHVSIPLSRGLKQFLGPYSSSGMLNDISLGSWSSLYKHPDSIDHLFGSQSLSGTGILSFDCYLSTYSSSISLPDVCHHHLAIGVLLLWSSHLYKSLWNSFGHNLRDIQSISSTLSLTKWLVQSFHLQLSLSLASLSLTVAYIAQVMYCCPTYPFIGLDTITTISIYVNHIWISSFMIAGAFAHFSIFLIRDFESSRSTYCIINRLLSHRYSVTSHLSFISLWLGFHVFWDIRT